MTASWRRKNISKTEKNIRMLKRTELDFNGVEPFMDNDEILFLFRPFRSKIFRTCNMPGTIKDDSEFVQVANTLSIHGRSLKGTYYFRTEDAEALAILAEIFHHMEIPHIFVEPDFSEVAPDKSILN